MVYNKKIMETCAFEGNLELEVGIELQGLFKDKNGQFTWLLKQMQLVKIFCLIAAGLSWIEHFNWFIF